MTLEELYSIEKSRIRKLSLHYTKMYHAEPEDLFQEGALAVLETFIKYAELPDEDLLKVSHRIVNRKIYKYARNEYRHKEYETNATEKD